MVNYSVGNGAPANAVGSETDVFIDLSTIGLGETRAYIRYANIFYDHRYSGGLICDGAVILAAITVAKLPAPQAIMKGWRATVTDATQAVSAVSFTAIVTGGGANTLPVWCDGTNWRVG